MRKVLVPSPIHKYPTDGLKILNVLNKIINMLNEIRIFYYLALRTNFFIKTVNTGKPKPIK